MRQIRLIDILDRCTESSLVWGGLVEDFQPKPQSNSLDIWLALPCLVKPSEIKRVRQEIAQVYKIGDVNLNTKYAIDSFSPRDIDCIRGFLGEDYPSLSHALEQVSIEYTGEKLRFITPPIWEFRISSIKTELEGKLSSWMGRACMIEVVTLENMENHGDELLEAEAKKINEQISKDVVAAAAAPVQKPQKKQWEPKKRAEGAVTYKVSDDKTEDIIYGRPQSRELLNISDLVADGSKVTVKGKIFFCETKKLNGKGKTVITFDIYDGTGSVRVGKAFLDDEVDEIKDELKPGRAVAIWGMANYSMYEKDLVIAPTAIVKEKVEKRRDKAAKKRVELHLHTTMSASDAFCDPKAAVALAESFGHRAVAITDHGVAQAYPDVMNAVEGINKSNEEFKAIYGIEAYFVNDIDNKGAVKGYTNCLLDDEIVVFDLETTGLSANNCEIIEIAAVVLKNGEQCEEYHSYIKPRESVPIEITNLTGITNSMVKDARPMEQVIPEFLDFIKGRPLVAHNADFDIGFMLKACEKLGIEKAFCSIDTVAIAKVLLPNLKRHRLNNIADFYGMTFTHHRALDDTKVLAQIVVNFWNILKNDHGVSEIDEINRSLERLTSKSGGIQRNSFHAIILVKNKKGLRNLYEMISHAHLKYFKRSPIMPMSMVSKMREGLIIGSACEAGELYSALVRGATWNELVKIAGFYDYLEIQPHLNNAFMVEKGLVKSLEQIKELNKTIVKLGEKLGKKVVATGDVHFLEPEDSLYREILMTGMGFSDASNQAPLYFKTTDEMLEEFSYLGEDKAFEVVVTNTNAIADEIERFRPIPREQFPPKIENSARDIEDMSRTKVAEIYGEDLPTVVSDRLKLELDSIIGHGFDVMYMIAQKLVSKSIEDGYLVGSRGSVGSSFVAFLTGITEVNALPPHYICKKCKNSIFDVDPIYQFGVDMPDKICPKCGENLKKDGFNIPFATFLGFDGDKTPDIDLNFSGEYQAKAHRETINIFGEENVFRAGTIGTIKDKTAYGFVKKYLDEKGLALGKAGENRLVQGCTGVKRTTGQHPGGLMVVPSDVSIYDFTPVQHPADDTNTDIITTHFDYHSIHDNLLKLDLLGHDDPTMIKELEDITGVNAREIPLDDKETRGIFTDIRCLKDAWGNPLGNDDKILGTTGSVAIPEFGTKFVRQMLLDTMPTTFEEFCRISGLSHGTDVWLNNAQDIIRSGKATLKDVICVRDDITLYLMRMGVPPKLAFTISESVRKGKGVKPDWEQAMKDNNVPDWYIESCKKIQYMFPRAHAVAYVMMAYRIAWFKVHRPLAFYSAYFSIRARGFDSSIMTFGDAMILKKMNELVSKDKRTGAEEETLITLEVCHEFYKRGFTFIPVDVYKSDVNKFLIEGDCLIAPLTSLPGVGEAAAEDIVRERVKEKFMSIEEMILRCPKVTKGVAETLENVNATGNMPKNNQISLF